jgi:hypothetical protein
VRVNIPVITTTYMNAKTAIPYNDRKIDAFSFSFHG